VIVLVGSAEDEHVAALRERLTRDGHDAVVLDALRFPEGVHLACSETQDDVRLDGRAIGRPRSVYLRGLYLSPLAFGVDVSKDMDEDWRTTLVIFREKAEMLIGVLQRWEDLGIPIYNPLSAGDRTRKPGQIARLAAVGVPVPQTLWSNDPREVLAFARRHGRVAYKPVAGGAATKELTESDLTPERLQALANAAVTFQELLPGKDYRVFVVDGTIAASYRIEATALDYRQNEESIESVELGGDDREACLIAARTLGLRFTGIDLKAGAEGKLRVLEANASPMFLGFDAAAGGSRVMDALAQALAGSVRS
jgi:glutathione synthase/RimK-type ligase-like ATP-grasp enzyme